MKNIFKLRRKGQNLGVTIVSKYLLDLHEKIYCNYIHMYIYRERGDFGADLM